MSFSYLNGSCLTKNHMCFVKLFFFFFSSSLYILENRKFAVLYPACNVSTIGTLIWFLYESLGAEKMRGVGWNHGFSVVMMKMVNFRNFFFTIVPDQWSLEEHQSKHTRHYSIILIYIVMRYNTYVF